MSKEHQIEIRFVWEGERVSENADDYSETASISCTHRVRERHTIIKAGS